MSAYNRLIAFDVWINRRLFKGQNETMSDRMGENLLEKNYGCCKWRLFLCKMLSAIDHRDGNHCIDSIEKID